MAALMLAGTAVTPLAMSWQGADHFRLPKELLLIALAIVGSALVAAGLVLRRLHWPATLRLPAAIAGAAVGWAALSTALSTNRAMSLQALLWGASVAALFLIMAASLRHVPPAWLGIAVLVPAVINATLVVLQAMEVWNPWTFEANIPRRMMRNALLGNPNDVGLYLAAAAVFSIAMFCSFRRWPYAAAAAVATAGLLATVTLTAIAALAAALIVMLLVARPRIGAAVALIAPPLLIGALLLYEPTQARLRTLERSVRQGSWGEVMSARLPAFLAAWEMFREHPLVGTGPGTFKTHYMTYYERVERRYPRAVVNAPQATIFAQTHNDHLQLLAETGLPGYLLVCGGMAAMAILVTRGSRGVARLLAAPTAALLFVSMLASFPLQLAAPVWLCVAMGGASLAWRGGDDVA
jgi:O-antigen ligase